MFPKLGGLRKVLSGTFIASMLLVSAAAVSSADTQSARTAKWVVSVTYQNIGTAASPVNVQFYSEGSNTPVSFSPGTLAAGAGKSFFIGNVSGLSAGFLGNPIMSAQQPLAATVVQFSQEAGFKMRLLSNGFDSNSTSAQYLVATVLKNKFSRTTVFSIQNTEAVAIDATINFYDADNAGALASTKIFEIAANSSKFIEMDNNDDTGITADVFNGSAIITAKTKGGADAKVVSAASEYYTNSNVGTNYEGLPLSAAANTLYMATALCANSGLDTFYAIQNASLTDSASVTVVYKNLNGTDKATDGPYNIGPGQKKSVNSCKPSDTTAMEGFTGAAVLTSTGAPIAAIGKAQNSASAGSANTADVLTAFLGQKQVRRNWHCHSSVGPVMPTLPHPPVDNNAPSLLSKIWKTLRLSLM